MIFLIFFVLFLCLFGWCGLFDFLKSLFVFVWLMWSFWFFCSLFVFVWLMWSFWFFKISFCICLVDVVFLIFLKSSYIFAYLFCPASPLLPSPSPAPLPSPFLSLLSMISSLSLTPLSSLSFVYCLFVTKKTFSLCHKENRCKRVRASREALWVVCCVSFQ